MCTGHRLQRSAYRSVLIITRPKGPDVKKDEKDAAKDDKHTKGQAAKHKAVDKVDMNKKDVNPIKVTPRA